MCIVNSCLSFRGMYCNGLCRKCCSNLQSKLPLLLSGFRLVPRAHTVIHVEIPIDPTKWERDAIMAQFHVLVEKFNKRHC